MAVGDLSGILISPTVFVVWLGAVLAALGYVANLALNWWTTRRKAIDERVTSLVRLQSLLQASLAIFEIQNIHAKNLLKMVYENHPELIKNEGIGYDMELANASKCK
ncbi:MAG: hypothetical protein MUO26_08180 [Methanotrichaceae archaeon]|nr:hypothetical protein [Methanotrichaceae archaeon]